MNPPLRPSHLQAATLHPMPALTANLDEEWAVELGWPGIDPIRPCVDAIVLDHSGSVVAVGGNDPIGNRFREAERAIKVVRAWTSSKRPKIAVIHFDQPSTADSGVITLSSRAALNRIRTALRVPRDAAGTSDLSLSLMQAEKLVTAYPDHDVRLTILSDFELTDADPPAVFERLAAFPGEVHAVVLNAEPPVALTGDNITITRLEYGDPPGALAAAIHLSLTGTRRGRRLSRMHADRTQPSVRPPSPVSPPRGSDR